ncbi:hypothetical protein BBJ28_00020065 [Nothophytophthora sp. Chile5]|nr:hypothetical protein BBJ28_00020065 [Nothophytophthora sp. Chile5]
MNSASWGELVDGCDDVDARSRWHSAQSGLVRTADRLGDHLVAELREAARTAEDDFALVLCARDLKDALADYEAADTGLLVTLARTGRAVRCLTQALESALGVLDLLGTLADESWRLALKEEREERVTVYEDLMRNEKQLERDMDDEQQQLELLTLLKQDLSQHCMLLTARELNVMSLTYDAVTRRSDVVVVTLPDWFATSEQGWSRAVRTTVAGGEETCIRAAAIWSDLHHPNVCKFYGVCYVGEPFVIHEDCLSLSDVNLAWRYLLGCTRGLQYLHDQGLAHRSLTAMDLFYCSSSKTGVLSGMDLVRLQDVDSVDENVSEASDIRAFGRAILKLLVKKRGPEYETLPLSRPDFVEEAEWDLLTGMCAADPAKRFMLRDVVCRMEVLAREEENYSLTTESSEMVDQRVKDVSVYEIQSLGKTLYATLVETDRMCAELQEFSDVNRPVVDRLVNVYEQLRVCVGPLPVALVDIFSSIVLRFFEMLEQRCDQEGVFGNSSAVATLGAARTLAGKNYSIHYDIDGLLRSSTILDETPVVHRWRLRLKEAQRRHRQTMDTFQEDPSQTVNEVESEAQQAEALMYLQFEGRDRGNTALRRGGLGRHLLRSLREAARADSGTTAIAVCSRGLLRELADFEQEFRLLVKLAETGRLVTYLTRVMDSALGILGLLDGPATAAWYQSLQLERDERVTFYEGALADDEWLSREMGDERQQLEVLSLLKYDIDQYSGVLTSRERGVMSEVYDAVSGRSGIVTVTLPRWFTTTERVWADAFKSPVASEEECISEVGIWSMLHHPNVRKFYGACHAGEPFVIHEDCLSLSDVDITWRHLLDCALGLQYVHGRGFVHVKIALSNLLYSRASKKGILSGMGLMRMVYDDGHGRYGADINRNESVLLDVLAFGRVVLELLARKHGRSREWSRVAEFPATRPGFMNEREWHLLAGMCAVDPDVRISMADIVYQMEVLILQERNSPEATEALGDGSRATVDDVTAYEIDSLGLTLQAALDEADKMCTELHDLSDITRPVLARLVSVYEQLQTAESPLPVTLVESFSDTLLRFFISLERRIFDNDFNDDRLFSDDGLYNPLDDGTNKIHREIDRMLHSSSLLDRSSAVHRWKLTSVQVGNRQHVRYQDDASKRLTRFASGEDRAESLSQRQFETRLNDTISSRENVETMKIPPSHLEGNIGKICPPWYIPANQVELGTHVDEGSFGSVYYGQWLNTDVVVKYLMHYADRSDLVHFRHEVDVWFSLNHENIIKLYGANDEGRQPFFVCEWASRGELASVLREGEVNRAQLWRYLWRASRGLLYLHENGIVHGDLKGSKLLVCENGEVKLSGFDLSFDMSVAENAEEGTLGAIRWKAPECLDGGRATSTSDVYSLGMCIIEAVTGEFPWGNSMPEAVVKLYVTDQKAIPSRPDHFSDEEWELVTQMCCFDPALRINAGAVVNLLYSLYAKYSVQAPATAETTYTSENTVMVPPWLVPSYQVELGKHIGDGSFGAVHYGRWLGSDVVVKLVLDLEEREQFRREADLWFALNHDNLITLYGACSENRPFFICERATHGTLESYLKGKTRSDLWRSIWCASLGLQHLHGHGIVHGDLKCNNILVCENGEVKLADFGLSFDVNADGDTVDGGEGAVGAFRWKAPEVLDGARATFKSDIYGFGMCIIEAVTGEWPWGKAMPDPAVRHHVVKAKKIPSRTQHFNDAEWELVTRIFAHNQPSTHSLFLAASIMTNAAHAPPAPSSDEAPDRQPLAVGETADQWHQPKQTAAGDQEATLVILSVNDVYDMTPNEHGRGGIAEFATLLERERAALPDDVTLLVTLNGDFLSGSEMGERFKG